MLSSYSFGNVKGYPLVFLHGFLGNHEDFAPILEHLSEGFHCICIELPGHGTSPMPGAEINLYSYCLNALKEFLPEKCTLIGYSMGGRIAMLFAQKHPQYKAILLSAHPGLEENLEARIRWNQKWSTLLRELPFEEFLVKWYAQPLFASLQKKDPSLIHRRKKQDKKALLRVFEELSIIHQPPLWDSLASLSFLFLFGDLDQKYTSIHERIKKINGTVKSKILPNAGHAIHLETPKRCADAIKQFVRRS